MNVPVPPTPKLPKLTPIVAMVAIGVLVGAYLIFLYGTWNQYQNDRAARDAKIDELLDKFPKPAEES